MNFYSMNFYSMNFCFVLFFLTRGQGVQSHHMLVNFTAILSYMSPGSFSSSPDLLPPYFLSLLSLLSSSFFNKTYTFNFHFVPKKKVRKTNAPGRALPAHKRSTCIPGRAALPVVPETGTGQTTDMEPLIKIRRMLRPSCQWLVRVGGSSCAREEFR